MERTKVKTFLPKQLFLVLSLLVGVVFCFADVSLHLAKEGRFIFGNFLARINGSVLNKNDSLLSQIEVDSDTDCITLCVTDTLCLSVNFGVNASRIDKVQCELFSFGGTDYGSYLTKKEGFFHMRMETICSVNPCTRIVKSMICFPHVGNFEKPFTCGCSNPRNKENLRHCELGNIKCNALGFENGTILNSQITASGYYSSYYSPQNGRLNAARSWYQRYSLGSPVWFQVDLLTSTTIVAVATQGRHNAASYVKTYQMSYSYTDTVSWITYKEGGIVKTFQGNVAIRYNVIVKNEVQEPFTAQIVRLIFKSWNTYPGIRMELYGCYN